MRLTSRLSLVLGAVLLFTTATPVSANNTAQTLPFSQDWTNIGLITADDNWSGVAGIEGFRGDTLTAANDVDPQTVVNGDDAAPVLDVIANQTNPNTNNTGGVAEFHLVDPVVALQGSGTADAPYLRLYLNTTGQSGITVSYRLRDVDGAADNAAQQVALQFRTGSTGNFTNVPAAYVADATTGPSLATQVTNVCVVLPAAADNQPLVQLRIMTTNATGNDEWVGIDDIVVNTAGCGGGMPMLNVGDVTMAEGDPPGTTTFTFAVTLTAPAGAGGVTFDIATADGTAQDDNPAVTEDNDYVAQSLTGQSIPMGSMGPYNFSVTVNRDTTAEPNETFFVNASNVVGAIMGDFQGQGTINNDDVSITPIHDIQGPGASSPIVGASVTTRGIVTGVRSNGFFIQEPDAMVDADPATSEGILVFGSPVPAGAVVGALVQVTGTVTEFVPPQDPLQPPLTELSGATVVQLSTGNPLPVPIPLTATFPDPAGPHDQLERLEGMRVFVASLTVVGPTLGNVNEANATATSTGVFYGVVTGVARPFREAGIPAPDPAPSGGGTIPPIPRFDSNPERIRVDSDGLVGGPLVDVGFGAAVTGLVGPLDYSFRTYTILPDPGASIGVTGGPVALMAAAATPQEFTVATYNVERLFDTVNDPGIGEPVLTAAAFDARLNKASLGIRNFLKMPDIVGMVEVENLTTLQALAARISSDAIAASQPDPEYDAYLVEGNDVGGIDVGFLVKTAVVAGSTPRVQVVAVQQELDGTLFVNPDSSTETLNDRPPLRLNAIVHHMNGASFPVTVIVNHMRSLNGVNSEAAGSNGWSTEGARVRAKRLEQAEDLANLVQARQTADPTERIILVGDFNAFEVNDGLGHSMAVIGGTPVPDNETAVPGDGVDLVNPDLDNLGDTPPPAERYSFIFDGNAQNLDHVLVNQPLIAATTARRIEHPRINADFPETARNDGTTAVRLSDHDPVVGYFQVAGFATADVAVTKTDGVTTATPGGSVTYTITASNAGPDPVTGGTVADTFPAILTCTWTCVGAGGGTCTAAGSGNISDTVNLPVGGSVTYTASCTISASATGTLSNTATVSGGAVSDPDPANNSATDTDTLTPQADLAITKTDGVTTATPGGSVTYTITASNAGPSDAPGSTVADTFPASLTCTWTCVGAGGGTCTASGSGNIGDTVNLPAGGSVTYTASCTISASATGTLSNTATVAAPAGVTDPTPGNNSATDSDALGAQADLSVTKSGGFVYNINVTNAGPSNAAAVTLSDMLPAGTTFQSLSAPAGWSCTTPPVGSNGTVSCTIASLPPGTSPFTLTIGTASTPPHDTVISNTAMVSSTTADPAPGNESSTADIQVRNLISALAITKTDTPDPVGPGGNITYTITATNSGAGPIDSAGISEFMPAGTTFVSVSAPAGWSCTPPPVGSNSNFGCNTVAWAPGSAVFTLVLQVSPSTPLGTTITNEAHLGATDGSETVEAVIASTTTQVLSPAAVTGTKTATGSFTPGSTVTYIVTLSNAGPGTQQDNPGNEFTDVLPSSLTLVSATASSGTAVATVATNTVTWNGSIPASGSVTITIMATINSGVAPGTTISNVGNFSYDADGNGTNEASGTTDNPATPGADSTSFVVAPGSVPGTADIPTLNEIGLALLVLLLAMGGAVMLRRRRV